MLIITIYYYITKKSGRYIELEDNIYLPDISKEILKKYSYLRCFNPSLFLYDKQIYYVYRISIGGDISYISKILSEIKRYFTPSQIAVCDLSNNKYWP